MIVLLHNFHYYIFRSYVGYFILIDNQSLGLCWYMFWMWCGRWLKGWMDGWLCVNSKLVILCMFERINLIDFHFMFFYFYAFLCFFTKKRRKIINMISYNGRFNAISPMFSFVQPSIRSNVHTAGCMACPNAKAQNQMIPNRYWIVINESMYGISSFVFNGFIFFYHLISN